MFSKIFPIVILTFVNTLGFSILIPVLPFIVRKMGMNEFIYGLLISSYSCFQFIGSPLFGKLSDRFGRKPILVYSQLGTLMAWIIMVGAWVIDEKYGNTQLAIGVIIFARILDGITGGNNSVANAYLSDVTPKEKKHIAFGVVGATLGMGMIIGPAIGAYTSSGEIGYLGMILFSIGLSTVTLFSIIFFLKESLIEKSYKKITLKERIYFWQALRPFLDRPIIMAGLKTRFFIAITMASYTSMIAILLIDLFQLSITELGNFLFFVGSFLIINQLLVKYFIKWMGEFNILWIGLLLMALGLFIFPTLDNLILFVIFYYLTNLGLSINLPTIKGLLSNHAAPDEQGEILGLDESIQALSMGVIPALSGLLYNYFQWKSFWFPATVSLIGALVLFRTVQKLNQSVRPLR